MGRIRKHLLPIVIGLVALAFVLLIRVADPQPVQQLRQAVFDSYQRAAPRAYQETGVRIVDIDDASLARLGQWPWPRSVIADLVRAMSELGAASIAFDMVFSEPDRTAPSILLETWSRHGLEPEVAQRIAAIPDPDRQLAETIASAPVVTGFGPASHPTPTAPARPSGLALIGPSPVDELQGFPGATVNLPDISGAAAGNGSFAIRNDLDSVLRRVPLFVRIGEEIYPSLSAEALRVALGARGHLIRSVEDGAGGVSVIAAKIGPLEIPTNQDGELLIHDTGPVPARYVPAWVLLDPVRRERVRAAIEGHIVLVGTSAAGLRDIRATPLAPSIAGVSLHAQAIEQIVLDHHLARPDWATGLEVVGFLALGLVLILVMPWVGALWSALIMLAAGAAGFYASWYAFGQFRLLFDPLYPAMASLAIYFPVSASIYMRGEVEKRFVRSAFARYLSPALVNRIAENPELLKLGGEVRELTLLFSDIRSFTTLSEDLPPDELVAFMNAYLTPMSEQILEREGFIDKYIGDAIMAFWNAPLDVTDHAAKACDAALGMRRALVALNADLRRRREAAGEAHSDLRIGVGINTGQCSVGNMGLEQRVNYSAMGDNVNLTARLESATKAFGIDILASHATVAATGGRFATLEVDTIATAGRSQRARAHALIARLEDIDADAFGRYAEQHEGMIAAYRLQDWQGAERHRRAAAQMIAEGASWLPPAVPLAGILELYRERIAALETDPPGPGWDRVYRAPARAAETA